MLFRGILPFVFLLACADSRDEDRGGQPARSTSGSEYLVVSLSESDLGPAVVLGEPISIAAEEEGGFVFVSDVEVSSAHGIVVMDTRASELRRFRTSGEELPPLAGPGQGPGEIRDAIGIAVQTDGTVWVNDFGNSRYGWYPPNGHPGSARVQSLERRGLLDGGVTDDGQPWIRASRSQRGPLRLEGGLFDGPISTYLVMTDLGLSAPVDSIFLGLSSLLTANLPRQAGSRRVRYTEDRLVAFDPAGAVWTATSTKYRLIRMDLRGDTTLVLDIDATPLELPKEIRREEVRTLEEWFRSVDAQIPSLEEAVPMQYPLIDKLTVDLRGRVWVQRQGEPGTLFESFTADGRPVGRYHVDVTPLEWGSPSVGNGHLVFVVQDSLGVQSLLVYRLPQG